VCRRSRPLHSSYLRWHAACSALQHTRCRATESGAARCALLQLDYPQRWPTVFHDLVAMLGQVRLCRGRFSLPVHYRCTAGDLGYREIRGALGLGYRFTGYKRTLPPAPSREWFGFIVKTQSKGVIFNARWS
jgi:hypothetical protein